MGNRRWPSVTSNPPPSILQHAECLQDNFEAIAKFVRDGQSCDANNGKLPKGLKKKILAGVASGVKQALANGFVRKSSSDRDQTLLRSMILKHIEMEAAPKARDRIPLDQFTDLLDSFSDLVAKLYAHANFYSQKREPSPVSAKSAELGVENSSKRGANVNKDEQANGSNAASTQTGEMEGIVDADSEGTPNHSGDGKSPGVDLLRWMQSLKGDFDNSSNRRADVGGLASEDRGAPDDCDLEDRGKDEDAADEERTNHDSEQASNEDAEEDEEVHGDGDQNDEDRANGSTSPGLFVATDNHQADQQGFGTPRKTEDHRFKEIVKYNALLESKNLIDDDLVEHNGYMQKNRRGRETSRYGKQESRPRHYSAHELLTINEANSHKATVKAEELEQSGGFGHGFELDGKISFAFILTIAHQVTVNRLALMPVRRMVQLAYDSFVQLDLRTQIQVTDALLTPRGDVEVFLKANMREDSLPPDLGILWGLRFERMIAAPLGSFAVETSQMRKEVMNLETRHEKAMTINDLTISNATLMKPLHGQTSINNIYWRHQDKRKLVTNLMVVFSAPQLGNAALEHGIVWRGRRYTCEALANQLRTQRCTRCQRFGHEQKHCRAEPRCGRCAGHHATEACTSTFLKCLNCNKTHKAGSSSCRERKARRANFRFPELPPQLTETKPQGQKRLNESAASHRHAATSRTAFPVVVPDGEERDPKARSGKDSSNMKTGFYRTPSFEPAAMAAAVQSLQAQVRELQASLAEHKQSKRRRSDSEASTSAPQSYFERKSKRIKQEQQSAIEMDELLDQPSPNSPVELGAITQTLEAGRTPSP